MPLPNEAPGGADLPTEGHTQLSDSKGTLRRRCFLVSGAAVIGSTALSYGRIIGANDRISLGHIGVGNRGRELASIAGHLKDTHNTEISAWSRDLWKTNRERAAGNGGEGLLGGSYPLLPISR